MLQLGGLKARRENVRPRLGRRPSPSSPRSKFKADATGVEFDDALYQQSMEKIKSLGPFRHRTHHPWRPVKAGLFSADLLTVYLLPMWNDKVTPILEKQLKKGARIVAHDFEFSPGRPPKSRTSTTTEKGAATGFICTSADHGLGRSAWFLIAAGSRSALFASCWRRRVWRAYVRTADSRLNFPCWPCSRHIWFMRPASCSKFAGFARPRAPSPPVADTAYFGFGAGIARSGYVAGPPRVGCRHSAAYLLSSSVLLHDLIGASTVSQRSLIALAFCSLPHGDMQMVWVATAVGFVAVGLFATETLTSNGECRTRCGIT